MGVRVGKNGASALLGQGKRDLGEKTERGQPDIALPRLGGSGG